MKINLQWKAAAAVALVGAAAAATHGHTTPSQALDELKLQVNLLLRANNVTPSQVRILAEALLDMEEGAEDIADDFAPLVDDDDDDYSSSDDESEAADIVAHRELRRRRKKRLTKWEKAALWRSRKLPANSVCHDVADYIEESESTEFSSCFSNPFTQAVLNQLGQSCLDKDRETCGVTAGCQWVANLWAANKPAGQKAVERNKCIPDPCYRINNGKCTLQHTGGRCVWYTGPQAQSVGRRGPGCFQSPCNNPTNNKRKGCLASGNDVYGCKWCGPMLGCQNEKMTSRAQCWNIGQSTECTGCNAASLSLTPNCPSEKCRDECCQSPFCTCLGGSRDSGDTALDINTED